MPNNKFSEQRTKKGILKRSSIPYFADFAPNDAALRALEECTVLQRETISTGGQYRFYLDPIAEYLAAANWILDLGDG